jgi:hypothetical protein
VLPISYVLPWKSNHRASDEFVSYVNALAAHAEVIVVDGSAQVIFDDLGARCDPAVAHLAPQGRFLALANGKVQGVLTGLQYATHEPVVIADDDVRYDPPTLEAVVSRLADAEVVRPQNYFSPMPWHAAVDTARTLINRALPGGDWPGTLAVRRSILLRTGGYDGNVLFENLELVRTVEAANGRALSAADIFVRRLPPATGHFWSQRVRQAYDEFARPGRLIAVLPVIPGVIAATLAGRWRLLAAAAALSIATAEVGRRSHGGVAFFKPVSSFCAPLWLIERGTSAWLALAARVFLGGVPYQGRILRKAANTTASLRERHGIRKLAGEPSSAPGQGTGAPRRLPGVPSRKPVPQPVDHPHTSSDGFVE